MGAELDVVPVPESFDLFLEIDQRIAALMRYTINPADTVIVGRVTTRTSGLRRTGRVPTGTNTCN